MYYIIISLKLCYVKVFSVYIEEFQSMLHFVSFELLDFILFQVQHNSGWIFQPQSTIFPYASQVETNIENAVLSSDWHITPKWPAYKQCNLILAVFNQFPVKRL